MDLEKMLKEADQRWPETLGLASEPETRHEDTARHWRANAAEEKRKKQHVSKLLAQALKGRDAAIERAERLEKDLRHYGRHTSICAMEQWFRANLFSGYCPDCDCGWQDTLAALEEE